MFFPYRFDRKFIGLWWPLGAREGVDGVTVTDQSFTTSFGRARVETPLANVTDAHVTATTNGGRQWVYVCPSLTTG